MKKKSLLILPVLLLALAACNKEEDVEVPEEVPEVTEPGDQGEDDGTQNPPAVQIDERVSVTKEAVSFEEAPSVTFENESDLVIANVVEDEVSGDITYYLEGSASVMDENQAAVFWNGVAAAGDKYVIVTISLEVGETASWIASDNQEKTAEPSSEDIVIRISGSQVSEEKLAGTATYTITDASGEKVNHIVDFSALFDTRIIVATGEASLTDNNVSPATATYTNTDDLAIASVKTDESGNVTYVLSGTANTMDTNQAQVYWNNVATAGEAFIVLTLKLEEGETVKWQAPDKVKTIEYANMERTGEEDLILRLNGAQSYGCNSATSVVFTITGATQELETGSEPAGVTHTVDFSNVVIPSAVTE